MTLEYLFLFPVSFFLKYFFISVFFLFIPKEDLSTFIFFVITSLVTLTLTFELISSFTLPFISHTLKPSLELRVSLPKSPKKTTPLALKPGFVDTQNVFTYKSNRCFSRTSKQLNASGKGQVLPIDLELGGNTPYSLA
uniref:Uncharacterized protein n=1 Tax=Salix viminalis TaxID=40686 RepID=A0A6N2NKW8_SALVM